MNRYGKETNLKPFSRLIKQNYKSPMVGVEIGIADGNHAFGMLNTIPNLYLYLIDPFMEYFDDYKTRPDKDVQMWYENFKKNLSNSPYKENIKFFHCSSRIAAKFIPNNLDFIYIDGNHSYEFCKSDIKLYFDKVKSGCMFGGDDYNWNGVKQAVDEFISKSGYELHTEEYSVYTSKNKENLMHSIDWWIIK